MLHSINATGHIEDVSDMWLTKLGYTRDEVVGRPSVDFLTESSRRYARDVVLPAFFACGHCDVEYEFVHKSGTVIPVRLRGKGIYDDTGGFSRSNAVLEDLSEQRALERKMVQTQKLESLGLMAGGIAHDFNNLLVAIIGNAQLALRDAGDSAEVVESVNNIVITSRRAADLCKQLLAYTGKGDCIIEDADVNELVREMVQVLEVNIQPDVAVKLDLAASTPHAELDATQLRQVVLNLVTNAAESMTEPGVVRVITSYCALDAEAIALMANHAAAPGEYVCLEVVDTGSGMSHQTIERMFDPFFTTKPTGRGLGLAAVHGIVRGHRGTLHVESELGKGTSFRVYFPTSDHDEDQTARPAGVVQTKPESSLRS